MVNIKVCLRLRFTWLSGPFLLFEAIANIASPPGWVTSLPQVTTPYPHVGSSGYPHHRVGSTGYPPPQRGLHRLRPSPTRASRVNPLSQVSSTGYLLPQRGPHKLPLSPKWAPQIFHPPPPPPSRGHFVIFILSCVFFTVSIFLFLLLKFILPEGCLLFCFYRRYRPIKLFEIAIPSPQIFIQEKTRDASFWISDLRAMTTK